MNFHENLRAEMARIKITNSELAKAVGVGYQTIVNYRSGQSFPLFRTLYKIQQTLGCDMNALFVEPK